MSETVHYERKREDYSEQFRDLRGVEHHSSWDHEPIFDFIFPCMDFLETLGVSEAISLNIASALHEMMIGKQSHYHSPIHILSIFDFAKKHNIELEDYEKLAIWFHDAIYNPKATGGQNEEMSALFMVSMLKPWIATDLLLKTEETILATANHLEPNENISESCHRVLDLDLFTFCTSKENNDYIADCIHKEYYPLDRETFDKNRKKFLGMLIAKGYVYRTESFQSFEEKAIENIKAALVQ